MERGAVGGLGGRFRREGGGVVESGCGLDCRRSWSSAVSEPGKNTMRMLIQLVACVVLCLPLAACTASGVKMMNKTGKTLNVEYLHLKKDGTLSAPYSTAVLVPEGQLKHFPPIGDGYVGERVRLLVADAPDVQGHSILLHIPDGKSRDFDVEYTAGRLFIREFKKGRDWSKTGDPDWGE